MNYFKKDDGLHVIDEIMSISVASTGTLPNGGEMSDGWDIDRWENDGGRSLSAKKDRFRDGGL